MTSSLVGSEMCIRDSATAACASHHLHLVGLSMQSSSNGLLHERKGSLPVSYTHLTLPTICSV
eukprot:1762476-Prorocentrum_lima.AAC.1